MARRGMATAPCPRAAPVPPPCPSAPSGLRRPRPPPHTPPRADDPILSPVPVPVANRILPPVCSLKDHPPFASLKNTAVRLLSTERFLFRRIIRAVQCSDFLTVPVLHISLESKPPLTLSVSQRVCHRWSFPTSASPLGTSFVKIASQPGLAHPLTFAIAVVSDFFYILFNSTLVWILFFEISEMGF